MAQGFCSHARRGKARISAICKPFRNAAGGQKNKPDGSLIYERGLSPKRGALRRRGSPEPVRVHDFEIEELGKAAPYGVYDIAANEGWVNVGIDGDTAAFAVESIRRWWQRLGKSRYPTTRRLHITADCGGSNGARVRLWKRELQKLANETGLEITVTHLPPSDAMASPLFSQEQAPSGAGNK